MHYTFDFSKDYILEDDCVLLRPLNANDCVNLRIFSQNEPDIWQFSLQKAAGEKNLQDYIQLAMMERENQKEYPFIVFDKRVSNSDRFAPVVAIAVVAFAFHNVYRQDRAVLFPPGSLAVPAEARQGDRAIRQEPD